MFSDLSIIHDTTQTEYAGSRDWEYKTTEDKGQSRRSESVDVYDGTRGKDTETGEPKDTRYCRIVLDEL